jgi:hypothetical protein
MEQLELEGCAWRMQTMEEVVSAEFMAQSILCFADS